MASITGFGRMVMLSVAFVSGLPESREEFDASLQRSPHAYGRTFAGGWEHYDRAFLRDFRRVTEAASKRGVDVFRKQRGADFGSVFGGHEAVILLSHWGPDDSVEFCDGFVLGVQVAAMVPVNFKGVLDLTVCPPLALVNAVVATRPLCRIRYSRIPLRPDVWLMFYDALSRWILESQETDYLNAFDQVAHGVLDMIPDGVERNVGKP
jgi:hypothetical protein